MRNTSDGTHPVLTVGLHTLAAPVSGCASRQDFEAIGAGRRPPVFEASLQLMAGAENPSMYRVTPMLVWCR